MLVTSREHQRMQCSLLVQQALGKLDHVRHTSSSTIPPATPAAEPDLDTELVASTVQKAFNRYACKMRAIFNQTLDYQK
jgi:hypothetical protein